MKIVGEIWIKEEPTRLERKTANRHIVTTEEITRRHLQLECGHTEALADNRAAPKYNAKCYECEVRPQVEAKGEEIRRNMALKSIGWSDDSAHRLMLYALIDLRDDLKAGYKPDIEALSAVIAKIKGEPV